MKDDLDKYISRRKRRDGKFAENFESGYQEFKVGVLLRHRILTRQWLLGIAGTPRPNGGRQG